MSSPQLFVFLSHGLESGPGSTKIQAMKQVAETLPGVVAVAIDHNHFADQSAFQARHERAQAERQDRFSIIGGNDD